MHLLPSISFLLLSGITTFVAAQDCGAGIGSCAAGLCCSEWGFCGTTSEHCAFGKCQPDFSDSCSSAPPPPSNLPRPRFGSLQYGQVIETCVNPGQVALTYDDGPWIYTSQLLDILSSYNAPATFFITGTGFGKGTIADVNSPWPALMKRMYAEGHQLAHHTWAHSDLVLGTPETRRTEIILNENAFLDSVGFYPTYFRCPYLSCDEPSGVLGMLAEYGYHVIGTNADTKDYEFTTPETVINAKNNFASLVSGPVDSSGYIVLAHDVHNQTVVSLTQFMIETARERGFKLVTVGECLGDSKTNWYRGRDGNAYVAAPFPNTTVPGTPNPPPTTLVTSTRPVGTGGASVSTDGTCGAINGLTCAGSQFGQCCSQWGFCGVTPAHCGTGCVPGFGTCGTTTTTSTPPSGTGVSVSTDGTCGAANRMTCAGSQFGQCCSQWGFCGVTPDHCGTGCVPGFGTCGTTTVSSTVSSARPSGTGGVGTSVSTDGTCGAINGMTCAGSQFGECCSQWGFCGGTTDHCGTGCVPAFGTCGTPSIPSSSSSLISSSIPGSSSIPSTTEISEGPTSTDISTSPISSSDPILSSTLTTTSVLEGPTITSTPETPSSPISTQGQISPSTPTPTITSNSTSIITSAPARTSTPSTTSRRRSSTTSSSSSSSSSSSTRSRRTTRTTKSSTTKSSKTPKSTTTPKPIATALALSNSSSSSSKTKVPGCPTRA